MRAIIIGAGVMGSASALELAQRGVDVVLLERAVPGAEASSAAAGMLGAQLESHAAGLDAGEGASREFQFFLRARQSYAAWAGELRETTGIDVGYRVSGAIEVALTDAQAEALGARVRFHAAHGARAEMLDARAALAVEPALTESTLAAAYFPDEAQVEPERLLRALSVAVSRHPRISLRTGVEVDRVLVEGGRAIGVALRNETLHGDVVILAAGSWSSLVAGVDAARVDVQPVRGQLLQLDERPARVRTIVAGSGTYVVPRGDGRIVCGSTLEFVGFQRQVTAGGIHRVLDGAIGLVPSLAGAAFSHAWSSFRPFSKTEKPLIGQSALAGLVLATGHHRNGILLAKTTSEAVRDAVLT